MIAQCSTETPVHPPAGAVDGRSPQGQGDHPNSTGNRVLGDSITVFVPGRPAPQGSKRYLGAGRAIESSAKTLAPWRADVRAELLVDGHPVAQFDGAVAAELVFVMPRPVSTPKRRTPPATKKPDLDKLIRAVLDAITSAAVWADDSQVVRITADKRLAERGETPGCHIHITPAQEDR